MITLRQIVLFPLEFLKGRKKSNTSIDQISSGSGAVVDGKEGKVAVYKDENGSLIKVSAKCTHLGCTVGWDTQRKIWACPCHGSEYGIDGHVIKGPAKKPLAKIEA